MKNNNEFDYFNEFLKSIKLANEATTELKRFIYNFHGTSPETEMMKLNDIENKADRNLHAIKNYLLKDFLPPIEREDIMGISYAIDDLVDGIDKIIININILNITSVNDNIKRLITLLEDATGEVYNLVLKCKNLKNIKEINEKIIEVNKIEEQANRLYEREIRELYRTTKDSIQIIKWMNIYETIEFCFNACEKIAECIEFVLVKNL